MNKQKESEAIERLKQYAPPDNEKYWICYSGGKDSDCIRILAELAGVPHEIHHNLTTVDAPETVQYIKTIPGCIIDKSHYEDGRPKTMWNLIQKKLVPPTRIMRYCCSELKEHGGKGRLKVTGVRWAESVARKERAGVVNVLGKPRNTEKRLLRLGFTNYRINKQGGIILNAQSGDNDSTRYIDDFMHVCYQDRSITVNPIVDWEDSDVWEFLHHYGCASNPLYQCGDKRIGCIGCPLSTAKNMKRDFKRYPKYKENYINAFDKMCKLRAEKGLVNTQSWTNGESVMKWWLEEDPAQLTFFDDDEIADIMYEMGVT